MAIGRTNAGGSTINYKVVQSLSKPSSALNNTIWLNTSSMKRFLITGSGGENSAYRSEGLVWIRTKDTGSPNFNLRKDKNIHSVILQSASVYLNGTWKSLEAWLYTNGSWVQFSRVFSATIAVTYPAGSTLTCTDGTATLTASTTTGSYTFAVPNSGTWTVKAVSGSNSASQSVSITYSGQSASVTLSYRTYLFKNGDQCDSLTGGWTGEDGYAWGSSKVNPGSISSGVISVTGSSSAVGVFGTWNKINFSAYKKLYVKASYGPSGSVGVRLVSGGNLTTSTVYAAGETPQGTTAIDVSGVTASAYVAFYATYGSLGVTEVWLEK